MAKMAEDVGQDLLINSSFKSFQSLKDTLISYGNKTFTALYIRSSRSWDSMAKKAPKKAQFFTQEMQERLCKPELDVYCIHGGKNYKSNSTGKRPNQKTYQKDCPFHIRIVASINGTLVVTKWVDKHNHTLSKAVYDHLPPQRRLDDKTKETVKSLLEVKANIKLIQNKVMHETGKIVLLRDIHNLAAQMNKNTNNLEELVGEMKKTGVVVDVIVDQNDNFQGILYQSSDMMDTFAKYPEVIMVDATYKLNKLGMPLYVMLVIDSNGLSEIAALWIVVEESKDLSREVMKLFKEHNNHHTEIKCVVTDKDMAERDVLEEHFPGAKLIICLFHVLQSFRREITMEKMGITSGQRTVALDIIQKLVYSKSDVEYDRHYDTLCSANLKNVVDYYNANWHPIREQWCEGLKNDSLNFLTRTNNRLESINQKIKSVVSKNSGLTEFWSKLMCEVFTLQTERNNEAVTVDIKVPVSLGSNVATEYTSILTPYANGKVAEQISLMSKVKFTDVSGSAEKPVGKRVVAGGAEQVTTIDSCQCHFRTVMMLPCRHILALRSQSNIPVYDEKLVLHRWTKEFYLNGHRVFKDKKPDDATVSISVYQDTQKTTLKANQKFKEVTNVSKGIAMIMAEMGMRRYLSVKEQLLTFKSLIESGKDVVVTELNSVSEDEFVGTDDGIIVNSLRRPPPATKSPSPVDDVSPVDSDDNPLLSQVDAMLTDQKPPSPVSPVHIDLSVDDVSPVDSDDNPLLSQVDAMLTDQKPPSAVSPVHIDLSVQSGSAVVVKVVRSTPELQRTPEKTLQKTSEKAPQEETMLEKLLGFIDDLAKGGQLTKLVSCALGKEDLGHAMLRYRTKNESIYAASKVHVELINMIGGELETVVTKLVQSDKRLRGKASAGIVLVDAILHEFAVKQGLPWPGNEGSDNVKPVPVKVKTIRNIESVNAPAGVEVVAQTINVPDVKPVVINQRSVIVSTSDLDYTTGATSTTGMGTSLTNAETTDVTSPEITTIVDRAQLTNNQDETSSETKLSSIKLPVRVPKRGRPKGSDITAIGLPRKKTKTEKVVPFIKLHPTIQRQEILSWIVRDQNVIDNSLNENILIDKCAVRSLETLRTKLCDDAVNIHLVRPYFKRSAWSHVEKLVAQLKEDPDWACYICNKDLGDSNSIGCDSCLEWYHLSCCGLSKAPKKNVWFCRLCCKKRA